MHLTTGPAPSQQREREEKLTEMTSDLAARGVTLVVDYSETMHDREIRLVYGFCRCHVVY